MSLEPVAQTASSLIDSLKSFEDVRLRRYQTVRDYQVAAADLSRAVGKKIAGVPEQ